jgi:hypothetical protein
MNDTSDDIAKRVEARYRAMTPTERVQIASALNDTARLIVESSLPTSLTRAERRLAVARRMYGAELPEAALQAHANYSAHGDTQVR